jgi:hypothetical protein
MSPRTAAALAALTLAAGGAGTALADDGHHGDDHAKVVNSDLFGSMPDGPAFFEVKPGGAPWVIDKGEAEVRRDGSVKVEVEGLIIPTTGTNPLNGIAATVFCGGKPVGSTKSYPFSPDGDAKFEARLATRLPSPCLVPAVLLNPAPNGTVNPAAYIAAAGA